MQLLHVCFYFALSLALSLAPGPQELLEVCAGVLRGERRELREELRGELREELMDELRGTWHAHLGVFPIFLQIINIVLPCAETSCGMQPSSF